MLRLTKLQLPVVSTRYVRARVIDEVDGVTLVDPTSDLVYFAFMVPGTQPGSLDFNLGSWNTIGSRFYAKIAVGPVGLVLPVGTYYVWIKIVDTEIPVEPVGILQVY